MLDGGDEIAQRAAIIDGRQATGTCALLDYRSGVGKQKGAISGVQRYLELGQPTAGRTLDDK